MITNQRVLTPLRPAARALTGSTYILLGFDALRAPGGRVDQAGPVLAAMRKWAPLPADDELMVRGNAAVQVAAGALLVLGKAPRLSALALAGSLIPTTLAGHSYWKLEDPARPQGAADPVPQEPGHDRRAAVRRARPAARARLAVDAGAGQILVRGSRLLLRALQPAEIDEQWRAMVTSGPMTVARLPDEASFKARLRRSGRMEDGWLDLAIDLNGTMIGRIQTFVPEGRPPAARDLRHRDRPDEAVRGKGYGREALALFTDWLFEHAAAQVVEAPTDPGNAPMRAVFGHVGWSLSGSVTEYGREWVMYRITRQEWQARVGGAARDGPGTMIVATGCPSAVAVRPSTWQRSRPWRAQNAAVQAQSSASIRSSRCLSAASSAGEGCSASCRATGWDRSRSGGSAVSELA